MKLLSKHEELVTRNKLEIKYLNHLENQFPLENARSLPHALNLVLNLSEKNIELARRDFPNSDHICRISPERVKHVWINYLLTASTKLPEILANTAEEIGHYLLTLTLDYPKERVINVHMQYIPANHLVEITLNTEKHTHQLHEKIYPHLEYYTEMFNKCKQLNKDFQQKVCNSINQIPGVG